MATPLGTISPELIFGVAAVAVVAVGVGTRLVRRRRRSAETRSTALRPSDDIGEDLAYAYYLDDAELQRLAVALNIRLPVSSEATEGGKLSAAVPKGPGVEEHDELKTQY